MFIFGVFATIPAKADGPAVVNLGTAGDFVILAKTGISTTGTTHITGDIGVSPASASYITGFDLTMDSTSTFSSSSVVTGKIYASDYTSPTPTKMTAAISDMETAYTDAAGRTLPDHTELYAGDVTGKTLTPGLYKWDTGLLISGDGVTISGASSDVWIFQIAGDLTVADSAIVTLSGGAKAANIFWQVAGHVTLGTTVDMKGIILCQTEIVFNTGATLVGRALAQTAVTLDANTITNPADTVPPTVSSTVPANAATGVAINSAMTTTFSEAMDPQTITSNTFTLKQGTIAVSGAVTYSLLTAKFTPLVNLAPSTVYTATITTGAKDLVGNAMASNYEWTFTTGAAADTTPPIVSSTVPANEAEGVAISSAMTATFSEAMDPLTITTTTFTLKQGTTSVSGRITYSQVSATFTPSSNLAANTTYTATITTGATDLAGNALATDFVWSFDTALAAISLEKGTITGRLVDENDEPIENATVSLGDTGLTTTTNSDGEYTFTDVTPGTYTLGFNASGYELAPTSVTVTEGQTTTVPDTTPVSSKAGSSNWWLIPIVIAAIAVAAIAGMSMMNRNKAKKSDTKGKKAGRGSNR